MSLRDRAADMDLDDLFNEKDVQVLPGEKIKRIPKGMIYSREQVRTQFNEETIAELSQNMVENGQIQPIVVFERDEDGYRIHAGERRWRAAKMAESITHVDCIIRDGGTILTQLSENIHREGVDAIDTSDAIQSIKAAMSLNSTQVAEKLGLKKATISAYEKVREAPQFIKDAYRSGKIPDVVSINNLRVAAADNMDAVKAFVESREDINRKDIQAFRNKLSKLKEQKPAKDKAKAENIANFELDKREIANMTISTDGRDVMYKFSRLGSDANDIIQLKMLEAMDEIKALREGKAVQ